MFIERSRRYFLPITSLWGCAQRCCELFFIYVQNKRKADLDVKITISSKPNHPKMTIARNTTKSKFPLVCIPQQHTGCDLPEPKRGLHLHVRRFIFIAALGKVTLSQPISPWSDSKHLQRILLLYSGIQMHTCDQLRFPELCSFLSN